jgi:hypothetical protein
MGEFFSNHWGKVFVAVVVVGAVVIIFYPPAAATLATSLDVLPATVCRGALAVSGVVISGGVAGRIYYDEREHREQREDAVYLRTAQEVQGDFQETANPTANTARLIPAARREVRILAQAQQQTNSAQVQQSQTPIVTIAAPGRNSLLSTGQQGGQQDIDVSDTNVSAGGNVQFGNHVTLNL